METPLSILVVGGGPAGVAAAIAAKTEAPAASVVLLSDEACEPYEKPPLSKAVLLGKVRPHDAPIAGPGGIAAHGVVLECDARCAAIDRAARRTELTDGRSLAYDVLVLATGSIPRKLPQLSLDLEGVHYLRTEADALALEGSLRRARELLVVGGGLIGLEVAASAAELGVRTTVLEVAPRILPRVCDEETGTRIYAAHRQHGVDIRVGTTVKAARRCAGGRLSILTDAGESFAADLVVVGTGASPNDALARQAGLETDEGVIVDRRCRSSDPSIYAAGDVVRFPGPRGLVRLENWRHAQEQGAVAGRNAAGADATYDAVPSFWSEQYDLYIQGVGWPEPGAVRVTRPTGNGTLVFELADGRLTYAMGINAQRDLAAARRLIERRIVVDSAALADPARPLTALLKR